MPNSLKNIFNSPYLIYNLPILLNCRVLIDSFVINKYIKQ